MITGPIYFLLVAIVGAVGIWFLLPPRGRVWQAAGLLLTSASAGFLLRSVPGFGAWDVQGLFWLLAAITLVSGTGAITSRSPAYCALWFAMSLLGTAGLMMFAGAQFLAVATVAVYAGAIVVTFLFVLMLAQPGGTAFYDRVSSGTATSLCSVLAGAVMIAILTSVIVGAGDFHQMASVEQSTGLLDNTALDEEILHPQHVAKLGGQLFARHLLAVELSGVLLMVALVGAIAMVQAGKQKPPATNSKEGSAS